MLRAAITAEQGLAAFSARDEFNQTAGTLAGKTAPVGGVWAGAGDEDFIVETTGKTAQRTPTAEGTGRYAIAGTTAFTNQVVQIDFKRSVDGITISQGALARYTDTNNFLRARTDYPNVLVVDKEVGGSPTTIVSKVAPGGSWTTGWWTLRLMVLPDGNWFVWLFKPGASPGTPFASGHDTDLATGGALASGKAGFYDGHFGGAIATVTRNYDNFAAWVPTLDAVLFANRSAELRTDGCYRQDSAGVGSGKIDPIGDLLRLPAAGMEDRSTELFVKATRGDFDQLPDSSSGDDIQVQVYRRPSWLFPTGDG